MERYAGHTNGNVGNCLIYLGVVEAVGSNPAAPTNAKAHRKPISGGPYSC